MVQSIGAYEVHSGKTNKRVKIWPLTVGTTLAVAVPEPASFPLMTGLANPLVVTNYGLFDLVILIPRRTPLNRATLTTTTLLGVVSGAGVESQEIYIDEPPADESKELFCQLTFVLDVGHASAPFEGSLHLSIKLEEESQSVVVPIQVRPRRAENALFLALLLIAAHTQYTWVKLESMDQASGGPLVGAQVTLSALRTGSVKDFNRTVPAKTASDGAVCCATPGVVGDQKRNLIALPIEWPLLFKFERPNIIQRVLMRSFTPAERTGHHNNNANALPLVRAQGLNTASLAGFRFALDPGHGVAYDNQPQARCYEWFVAHRTATRIAELLRDRHGVAASDIGFARTAGLALVAPTGVTSHAALTTGESHFEYDMKKRELHTRVNERTLTDVSDLLLTEHAPTYPFAALPLADTARSSILTENTATIATAIQRAVNGMRPKRSLVSGSERWDGAQSRYVYDTVPATDPRGAIQTHPIEIKPSEKFRVTDAKLRCLAARTARWSLACEGLQGTTIPFVTNTRAAMMAQNAVQYMTDAVFAEASKPAAHVFNAHGIRGWAFGKRRQVFNAQAAPPHFTLTLHLNAIKTHGQPAHGVSLIGSSDGVTQAHLRLQKTFIKYVTGLGQGLHGAGISDNHPSRLNGTTFPKLVSGYAFFENEFMNAGSEEPGITFEYERLVKPAFVEQFAQEIVAGLVDFVLDPQPNAEFDPIRVNGNITVGPVVW